MHRAYQSITPANNSFLKHKWDQLIYDRHRKKVKTVKAVIDNAPPKTYVHLHLKLKKLQMQEERMAIVERDNRILLDQMAHMMKTGGRVDNRNDYKQRSLNKTKRQQDLLQISHQNHAILQRIKSRQSHYNHMQWEQQWLVNQGYMMNISKYPQPRKTASKTKTKKATSSGSSQQEVKNTKSLSPQSHTQSPATNHSESNLPEVAV
ncbi:sperm axonemal maintenance protein CFAP97D1-like [Corticium candelabrum]|uniref:sperm axonemal maintenance protein CFAP97D1-like n=1 Tax=Corticium candelabrum TaxID=121492 RepID=UPI002E26DE54|nr:sperm axonemal maintenance protein CFAP97D1-like [Corticium candelabrum]